MWRHTHSQIGRGVPVLYIQWMMSDYLLLATLLFPEPSSVPLSGDTRHRKLKLTATKHFQYTSTHYSD
jgi:hypothetical protein